VSLWVNSKQVFFNAFADGAAYAAEALRTPNMCIAAIGIRISLTAGKSTRSTNPQSEAATSQSGAATRHEAHVISAAAGPGGVNERKAMLV
jgi:hypothetical protein